MTLTNFVYRKITQIESSLTHRLDDVYQLIKFIKIKDPKLSLHSVGGIQRSLKYNQLTSTMPLTRTCSLSNELPIKQIKSANRLRLSRSMTETCENVSKEISGTCSYAYQELKSSLHLNEDVFLLDQMPMANSNSNDNGT